MSAEIGRAATRLRTKIAIVSSASVRGQKNKSARGWHMACSGIFSGSLLSEMTPARIHLGLRASKSAAMRKILSLV